MNEVIAAIIIAAGLVAVAQEIRKVAIALGHEEPTEPEEERDYDNPCF